MKKDYVNLKIQVVEVQLSDCIAGSTPDNPVRLNQGISYNHEIDAIQPGSNLRMEKW